MRDEGRLFLVYLVVYVIGIYSYLNCHPGGGGWIKILLSMSKQKKIDNEKRIKSEKDMLLLIQHTFLAPIKCRILISLKIGNQHECSK